MARKKDTLDRLTDRAQDVSEQASLKKLDRPVIKLKGKNAEAFDKLVGADAVLKTVGADQAERKKKVTELLAGLFVRMCVELGRKLDNPLVTSGVSLANLQVKHSSAVRTVEDPEGNLVPLADQFRAQGFEDAVIKEIVDKVVQVQTTTRLRSFTELAESDNPVERKLGKQVMAYIEKFNEDNQQTLLEKTTEVSVDKCWKDFSVALACRLAEGDMDKGVEILKKLWAVIPVDYVLAQFEFGGDKAEAFGKILNEKKA